MTTFSPQDIDWYFINLDCRPDRAEHARKEFARHGIEPRRFEAFEPSDWHGDPYPVARMQKTPGAIGCFMSQMDLIRTAEITGRVVAVCEDDVCFCSDLPKRLDYIAKHLTWDWDIFYLGATFHVPGVWCKHEDCAEWGSLGFDAEPTKADHIMRVCGEWGTYAYLVNPVNAEKVHRLFVENIHRARGIDHLAIILGDQLDAFCFVPGCAWQYDGPSNIRVGGFTKFSDFKALGPWAWTDKMEDFDAANFNWNNFDPKRWDGKKGVYHEV